MPRILHPSHHSEVPKVSYWNPWTVYNMWSIAGTRNGRCPLSRTHRGTADNSDWLCQQFLPPGQWVKIGSQWWALEPNWQHQKAADPSSPKPTHPFLWDWEVNFLRRASPIFAFLLDRRSTPCHSLKIPIVPQRKDSALSACGK